MHSRIIYTIYTTQSLCLIPNFAVPFHITRNVNVPKRTSSLHVINVTLKQLFYLTLRYGSSTPLFSVYNTFTFSVSLSPSSPTLLGISKGYSKPTEGANIFPEANFTFADLTIPCFPRTSSHILASLHIPRGKSSFTSTTLPTVAVFMNYSLLIYVEFGPSPLNSSNMILSILTRTCLEVYCLFSKFLTFCVRIRFLGPNLDHYPHRHQYWVFQYSGLAQENIRVKSISFQDVNELQTKCSNFKKFSH